MNAFRPFLRLRRQAAAMACAASALVLYACATPPATLGPAPDYAAVIAAPDRAASDREIDARRKQPQMLAFTGVRQGMRALDMSASAGYTTELLARAVGPTGKVWAQNPAGQMERSRLRLDERMKTPAMANVVRVTREFEDPVPPEAAPLNLITFFFSYHDVTYGPTDRAKMNRRMFEALEPGGMLVIADHAAKSGAGVSVAKTLHRIDEATVRAELEAAGFRLVEEASFLRNYDDKRDTMVFRSPVPVDQFVMKFVRPR